MSISDHQSYTGERSVSAFVIEEKFVFLSNGKILPFGMSKFLK